MIDAAEMYHAEELAGQQCMGAGARRCQHVISDPCPSDGTEQAFGRSLWVASICISALDKTLSFFGDSPRLAGRGQEGAILQWGMSNPDVAGTEDSLSLPQGKDFAVAQALYDSEGRVIGYGLVPWCSRCGIPVMAYVPMGDRRFGNMRLCVKFHWQVVVIRFDVRCRKAIGFAENAMLMAFLFRGACQYVMI